MSTHAGWKGDVTPGTAIFALAVIVLGIPAALVLAAIGLATWLGVIVWFF